jgi:hypothetical protein
MVSDNVKAGLLTLFLGGPGDLASRILWYNCSISKPWTMAFMIPPFSIVSAIMHFTGKIEKATQGCLSSFDFFLFIIPIFSIILEMFIPRLIENDMISTALTLLATFIMFMVIRTYKSASMCNVHFQEKYTGYNTKIITQNALISLTTIGIIKLFNMIAPFGEFIPVVGIAFRVWGFMGMVPGLQTALPLTFVHFILNLYQNVPDNMRGMCLT